MLMALGCQFNGSVLGSKLWNVLSFVYHQSGVTGVESSWLAMSSDTSREQFAKTQSGIPLPLAPVLTLHLRLQC